MTVEYPCCKCGKESRWQVELRVWALSTGVTERNPTNCVTLLSNVTVCDACKGAVKAQEYLLPEGMEQIAAAVLNAGREMPDFTTAGVNYIEIIDAPVDVKSFANGS